MNSGISSQMVWVVTGVYNCGPMYFVQLTGFERYVDLSGASAGLGLELTLAILARGDKVVASARSEQTLLDLRKLYPERFTFLQLDVTDTFEAIQAKAKQAAAVWGRIDVLINNAGYSIVGTIEEARLVSPKVNCFLR
jgi:NADP-dependent 3-hydroxy acid dehydrogenase YdfG